MSNTNESGTELPKFGVAWQPAEDTPRLHGIYWKWIPGRTGATAANSPPMQSFSLIGLEGDVRTTLSACPFGADYLASILEKLGLLINKEKDEA